MTKALPDLSKVILFHGSGSRIDSFSYEYTEHGHDEIGSGFYFTSDPKDALSYTSRRLRDDIPKPGGEDSPTVMVAKLRMERPLRWDAVGQIPAAGVRKIINASPKRDDALSNWGDIEHDGLDSVLTQAASSYASGPRTLLVVLNELSNDFFKGEIKAFNEAVRAALGYDCVVKVLPDGHLHVCAFFPDQIELIAHSPAESFRSHLTTQEGAGCYGPLLDPTPSPAARRKSAPR